MPGEMHRSPFGSGEATMNLRRQKQVLSCVAMAILAIGIGILVWSLAFPVGNLGPLVSRLESGTRRDGNPPDGSTPTLEQFQAVWDKPLRRPLVDPPPTTDPKPPPRPTAPPLTAKLIGTIVEGDHATALFALPDGSIELKDEGEVVQGSTIVSIKKWGVTLQVNNQMQELRLEENSSEGLPVETVQAVE